MNTERKKGFRETIEELLVKLNPSRIEEAQRRFLERPKVKLASRIAPIGAVVSILLALVYFPLGFVLFLCCWCAVVYLFATSSE